MAPGVSSEELDATTLRMGARTVHFDEATFVRFDSSGGVAGGTGHVESHLGGRPIGLFPLGSGSPFRIAGDTIHLTLNDRALVRLGDPDACHLQMLPGAGVVSLGASGVPDTLVSATFNTDVLIGDDAECLSGAAWPLTVKNQLSFHPNGRLKRATIAYPATLEDSAGLPITVAAGDIVDLSLTGRVESITRP